MLERRGLCMTDKKISLEQLLKALYPDFFKDD